MNKTYFLISNACERRDIQSITIQKFFSDNNYFLSNRENANYIIFSACGMLEDDSEQRIFDIVQTLKNNQQLIIFGCFVKMYQKEKLKQINVHYIPLREIEKFNEYIKHQYSIENIHINNNPIKSGNTYLKDADDPRMNLMNYDNIFTIRLSEGCSETCSYCSIKLAIGELNSKKIDDILSEIKKGLNQGYNKIHFQCENSGDYGKDINTNLGNLLDEIAKIDMFFSIDLPDLHPKGFLQYFDSIYRFLNEKNILYIHLPIQSGSQSVLNKMEREYNIFELRKKLKLLKGKYQNLKIGTDIIIGFPSEQKEDFLYTYNLLEEFNFDWIYLHGFNLKKGTKAEEIEPKIESKVIEERIEYIYNKIDNIYCYLNNYKKDMMQ